ncbi:MAG: SGNH/GDSL hydrolase family protein [Planctomycetes bacterium]|nr:SGNH/GDSL hydrolase family protein [Planctomycetota bacterium]
MLLAAAELVLAHYSPCYFQRPQERLPGQEWKSLIHGASNTPGLEYELRPNVDSTDRGVSIRTNSLGMRGPELAVPRDPRSLRIGVLGDSVAFGIGLPYESTWSRVCVDELGRALPARPFELLNCAVSGYSSRDEACVLESKLLPLDPDLVIVGYFLNDPEPLPLQPLQNYFHEPAWWQHFDLLRRIAQARRTREVAHLGGGDLWRFYHAPQGEPWKGTRAALERMAGLARARGVHVMLIVTPVFAPLEHWSEYPYESIHAQVTGLARELGWHAFDLFPALRDSGLEPPELRLDESHPNVAGSEIIGRAVASELRAHPQLLEPAHPR